MAVLRAYRWPGNVRELQHIIERAVILSQSPALELGNWFISTSACSEPPYCVTLEEAEHSHILTVLESTGWRVSGAHGTAEILGLKPTTLESRMKKLGIMRPA